MRIGFIGLGRMGWHIAAHLVGAGHEVTAFDVADARAAEWQREYGGTVGATVAETADGAAFVVSSLPADAQLREVAHAGGLLDALAPGAVWVDHTTSSASVARELSAAAHEGGAAFLDAPVSGGVDGARGGSLTVMVGGDADAYERAEQVMVAYAARVAHLGESGAGQLTKMTNQICVVGLCQALAEGLDFAEAAGLDTARVVDVMLKGASASWQMENRATTMLAGEFDFGFATELMRKDIGLCLAEARELDVPLPVTALVDQFLADVERMGGARQDWSALIERQRLLRSSGAPSPREGES